MPEKKTWDPKQWNADMLAVLSPFRRGISHGGSRADAASKKKRGSASQKQKGTDSLAVGNDEKKDPTDPSVQGPKVRNFRCSKKQKPEQYGKHPSADAAIVPVRVPIVAAIGVDGVDSLRDKLRLQFPCRLVGEGTFGKVYRMSAVPCSGAAEAAPQTVAVKVMSKLDASAVGDQDAMCIHVRREIELLTMTAGSPGIVEFLSWSEGIFDVQLAFPFYTENLHSYTHRGAFKVTSAVGDKSDQMPSICQQLLTGLSRLHDLQILHRDVKPSNMLIHVSAVGDVEKARVVLADLGGAIHVSAVVGDDAPCPTTYHYRAPELFIARKLRVCSYACDVWAMGTSIAHMDLGETPFGRASLRSSEMEEIFDNQLRVLYNARSAIFDATIRKDKTIFLQKLSALRLQGASCLPWGRYRGRVFQDFLRIFFLPSPESRPLARTLAQDKALSE